MGLSVYCFSRIKTLNFLASALITCSWDTLLFRTHTVLNAYNPHQLHVMWALDLSNYRSSRVLILKLKKSKTTVMMPGSPHLYISKVAFYIPSFTIDSSQLIAAKAILNSIILQMMKPSLQAGESFQIEVEFQLLLKGWAHLDGWRGEKKYYRVEEWFPLSVLTVFRLFVKRYLRCLGTN